MLFWGAQSLYEYYCIVAKGGKDIIHGALFVVQNE